MAEIKEFKKTTQEKAESGRSPVPVSKISGMKSLSDLLQHPRMPLAAIVVFAILFLLDLYLMVHFTFTGITACCILLVVQTLLAVCLDRLNYAGLLCVAAVEVVIGALSHNFLLSVLCLIPYFMALFVIHVLRLHDEGVKAA